MRGAAGSVRSGPFHFISFHFPVAVGEGGKAV